MVISNKKLIKWGLVGILVLIFIIIYQRFNPSDSNLFPKCPFRIVTGYECAGCGSQRAIHYLLNLNVGAAFRENPLLVTSIPYIITGFIFDIWQNKQSPTYILWRKRLFGLTAIYLVLFIVITFWILRNIFPDFI